MSEKLHGHFMGVHELLRGGSKPLSFSIGVNATVIVKARQHLDAHNAIVGKVYLHHFLDVQKKSNEETRDLLKSCIKGKQGEQASEAKVAVVTLQEAPNGTSPSILLLLGIHKQSMKAMTLKSWQCRLAKV